MTYPVLTFRWQGDSFVPASKLHAQSCDRAFIVGEIYHLAVEEPRSSASHRAYFASIRECWLNLSDDQMQRWPYPDALRKWALIAAGFRDERFVVCGSPEEACKIAAFMRPIDPHAVVAVEGSTVIYATARSQSVRAMDRDEFKASKEAVLNLIASEIGVSAETLLNNTGKAA